MCSSEKQVIATTLQECGFEPILAIVDAITALGPRFFSR